MHALIPLMAVTLAGAGDTALQPGDYIRQLEVDGQSRRYIVHVPQRQDPAKPAPIVLALHGAAHNGRMFATVTNLNATADRHGFVAVYPEGLGLGNSVLFWNSGGVRPALEARRGLGKWADALRLAEAIINDSANSGRSAGPTTQPDDASAEIVAGPGGVRLAASAGQFSVTVNLGEPEPADDVKYIAAVLDDLATVVPVDAKRVYAAGSSNGAMMCYKLAAELGGRIAAIAAVSGTLPSDLAPLDLKRPVPVIHFHGTADDTVPFAGSAGKGKVARFLRVLSVDDTMAAVAKANGCRPEPRCEDLPDRTNDGTTVKRYTWPAGRDGAEVVLYRIEGGGHAWPGRAVNMPWQGKTCHDIEANELIWQFFDKHARK